ncbi:substrate-binding periplasmic protein [Ornithinimicrobium pratense]|uniref:ABC transporter substrate-binding protein n=1 Tax=Ornithinimicrobium pratense TaxID=2593973 RepID=A0A5J6V854_9MICO|nr:ABC transporter substrate-binding protein [Ornithinimicrobium pratense]QFG69524.1 ABC transporter substrate-binding protein [Ornithinimicrobium pratense]
MSARSTSLVSTLLGPLLLAGCALDIPADPDGTLESIRSSGELSVGVSPQPPFTTLPDGIDEPPAGTEIDLVTGFAQSLSAEPTWVVGGEESLMRALEEGELDVVVGGLTAESPWGTDVALTRPYLVTVEDGEETDHVMAVVPGENALLSALERYLDGEQP